jgi:hypothetical protein
MSLRSECFVWCISGEGWKAGPPLQRMAQLKRLEEIGAGVDTLYRNRFCNVTVTVSVALRFVALKRSPLSSQYFASCPLSIIQ